MNENTREQETESRPEDAQASEQVKAVSGCGSVWIKCCDGLPNNNQIVDIWCNPGDQFGGFRRITDAVFYKNERNPDGIFYYRNGNWQLTVMPDNDKIITHWMPVPESPNHCR